MKETIAESTYQTLRQDALRHAVSLAQGEHPSETVDILVEAQKFYQFLVTETEEDTNAND